jgi:hypothetical protein
MRISATPRRIAAVTCLALFAWHITGAQESKSQGNAGGLHAGVTAQLTQGYSEPSVMVAFLLLNDPRSYWVAEPVPGRGSALLVRA